MFADVTSANIVGYTTKESNKKAYDTFGSMFVSVNSAEKTWKLGDMKMLCLDKYNDFKDYVDGGAYRENVIQFLDPVSSVIDADKIYTYYGANDEATVGENDGWYTVNDDSDKDDIYSNDVEFPCGTAFLCNFAYSEYDAKLTFSGQVLTSDVTISSEIDDGKGGLQTVIYMYLVNPIPTDLTLGDIKMLCLDKYNDFKDYVDGGAYRENVIQFIDPTSSVIDPDRIYTYYGANDEATVGENDGWYTVNDDSEKDDLFANDAPFKAGEGFLCNFAYTEYKAKLIFKNPINK